MFENFEAEAEALHITLEGLGFELDISTSTCGCQYQWSHKPNGLKAAYELNAVHTLVFSNIGIKISALSRLRQRLVYMTYLNQKTKFGHLYGHKKSIEFIIHE